MVTTLYARGCACDAVNGRSYLEKSKGFLFLNRFFSKGWVAHSPTVMHFIGLKPRRIYETAVRDLRAQLGFHTVAIGEGPGDAHS